MILIIKETKVIEHKFDTDTYPEEFQGKSKEFYVKQLKEACEMVGLNSFSDEKDQSVTDHFIDLEGELL